MQQEAPAQRLRITFARGEEIKYISHLDIMRMWERILRRAQVPLAYSHGFNPQPRMALAAPLPVGVLGDGELMDVFLDQHMSPRDFLDKVQPRLPAGVQIRQVEEVPIGEPSLQSRVRFADYEVKVKATATVEQIETRIRQLLEATEVIRERRRDNRVRRYDLRPLINSLGLKAWNSEQCLQMRLRNDPSGAGRPEEVVVALDLDMTVQHIRRIRLVIDHD